MSGESKRWAERPPPTEPTVAQARSTAPEPAKAKAGARRGKPPTVTRAERAAEPLGGEAEPSAPTVRTVPTVRNVEAAESAAETPGPRSGASASSGAGASARAPSGLSAAPPARRPSVPPASVQGASRPAAASPTLIPPARGSFPPPPPTLPVLPSAPRSPAKSSGSAESPGARARGAATPAGAEPRRGRPPGAFSQHRRIDRLRALLVQYPSGLSVYEIASRLGVTPRSARRYLAELEREFAFEGKGERPGGVRVFRLASSDVPRNLPVRRTQAYALLAARRLFELLRGSALYDEIELATSNLLGLARRPGRGPNAGVADARLEERFLYLPFAAKDYSGKTEELDALFQAVADLRPLRCFYRRVKDDTEEALLLHPYAMVLYKDSIYCVGLHVARGEVRTFLLDRMRDAECAAVERFELPDDFRIDRYFQGQFGIFRGDRRVRVVIDFDQRVAEFVRTRRVHPTQTVEALEGGGLRLTMEIGDLTEVGSWVLGFGDTARVLEPPELVERVVRELSLAAKRYAEAPAALAAPRASPSVAPGASPGAASKRAPRG